MAQVKYVMVKDKNMVKVMNIKVLGQQNVTNISYLGWSEAFKRSCFMILALGHT